LSFLIKIRAKKQLWFCRAKGYVGRELGEDAQRFLPAVSSTGEEAAAATAARL
jgi:hypothetical protein